MVTLSLERLRLVLQLLARELPVAEEEEEDSALPAEAAQDTRPPEEEGPAEGNRDTRGVEGDRRRDGGSREERSETNKKLYPASTSRSHSPLLSSPLPLISLFLSVHLNSEHKHAAAAAEYAKG
jgi:hypothetical protein